MELSIASAFCSVTTASSAVRPTLTELEIPASADSISTGVVNIKQRARVEAPGAADEHPERSADDSDEEPDDTSAGCAEHERRFGPVRFDYLPVVATDNHECLLDDDLLLRVKLLE